VTVPLQIARRYARYTLARALDGVWTRGLAGAAEVARVGPVLFVATHSTFWDGLVLLPLDEALGTDGRVLMDQVQLDARPYFRAIGAIGIDRTGLATARHGLAAATAHLSAPGRAVWVFPQGRQRPTHLRPLDLRRGFEVLVRRTGARLVPVALALVFLEDHRPRAFVDFGSPVDEDGVEAALVAGLDRIDRAVETAGCAPFEVLVPTVGGRLDSGVGPWLLARMFRW
jgi:1-acyl-sn-glycerol-3-phosphate acyltransferase